MAHEKVWGWGFEGFGNAKFDEPMKLLCAFLGLPSIPTKTSFSLPQELPPPAISIPSDMNNICDFSVEERLRFSMGQATRDVLRYFLGEIQPPEFVFFPRSKVEVKQIFSWAQNTGTPIFLVGGGSSVCGGYEGRDAAHWVALSLRHYAGLISLDKVNRLVTVEPGMYAPKLQEILRNNGLTLRHFPQSFQFSTIGGWVATRNGGHFATGPTHIDEFVHSLTLIAPNGDEINTIDVPESGSGPSAKRLILGTEGILGLLTDITLRVTPIPKYFVRARVEFPNFVAGLEGVQRILQSGLQPSNCRLIDAMEAMAMGATKKMKPVLLLAFESHSFPKLQPLLDHCVHLAGGTKLESSSNSSDSGPSKWKKNFIFAPYLRDELLLHGFLAETFETSVNWSNAAKMYNTVKKDISALVKKLTGFPGFVTCRITHAYTDGCAPYFTVIARTQHLSLKERLHVWDKVKSRANDLIISNGGCATHHHAVGRDHQQGFVKEAGPGLLSLLRAMKHHLDPTQICNPGILIPKL